MKILHKTILGILAIIAVLLAQLTFLATSEASPVISGCAVFSDDNIWNTAVDSLPVDENSQLHKNSN